MGSGSAADHSLDEALEPHFHSVNNMAEDSDQKKRHRERSISLSPSPPPLPRRNISSRSPVRDTAAPFQHSEAREAHEDVKEDAVGRRGVRNPSLTVAICKDFTRNRCMRSPLECKYAHPAPAVTIQADKVTVCHDSLRDRCSRGLMCRYYHPPPHIRLSMQKAAGIEPSPVPLSFPAAIRTPNFFFGPPGMQYPLPVLTSPPPLTTTTKPLIEVCRDYIRERCAREVDECRYAHHAPTPGEGDYAVVCQDYLRGRCGRGSCRYFHVPEHLKSRINYVPVGPPVTISPGQFNSGMDAAYTYPTNFYEQQAVKRTRIDDNIGDNRSRGSASQHYGASMFQARPKAGARFVPSAPPRPSRVTDQDRLPVCWDFQKNMCSRESCKFVHPEPETEVVDNYVTICPDFQSGKCSRESCHFYHPLKKSGNQNNEQAVDSFSPPPSDVNL